MCIDVHSIGAQPSCLRYVQVPRNPTVSLFLSVALNLMCESAKNTIISISIFILLSYPVMKH